MYQALYRKYRPLVFTDVVGQEAVTRTLVGQLAGEKLGHAYLFTGTRGTGKTTCAKILARAVNCEHPRENGDPCNECAACRGILNGSVTDVFEIDAASNNSVDDIRELREDIVYTPALVKYKVYIIDEVHRLSGPAFDALLKTVEEPPAHVIFILATTELHKVPATILSRCQRFDFRRIDAEQIGARLEYVAGSEGIALSHDAALMLGRMGRGSMRDALSLLERAAALDGQVNAAAVSELMGMCDPERLIAAVESIASHDIAATLRFVADMWRESKDMQKLLGEMAVLLRDATLVDIAPDMLTSAQSEAEIARLTEIQNKMGKAGLLGALETLQRGMRELQQTDDTRVVTEIMLMRMCDPRLDTAAGSLITRMERLEKAYAGLVRGEKRAAPTQKPTPAPAPVPTPAPAGPEPAKAPPAPVATPAPVEQPTPVAVPAKTEPIPAPAAAGVDARRIWSDALTALKTAGREDLLTMLDELKVPKIEGGKVLLELDKDSFTRRMLTSEPNRKALSDALAKAAGNALPFTFVEPVKPEPPAPEKPKIIAPPPEEDGLLDIIEALGDDVIIEG